VGDIGYRRFQFGVSLVVLQMFLTQQFQLFVYTVSQKKHILVTA
jgi:hypothetical protein